MTTLIYEPTGGAAVEPVRLADSPPSLGGLRIAVLDNGKPNAGVVMRRAAESLAERTGATVSLVTKKGPGGRSANAAIPCADDIVDRLTAEADVVITGAADCGSCTAYSVFDAITLERLGRPTAVVTTTRFRPIAETMASSFGLAATRLLVLPHPLGGTSPARLHEWADAAVPALERLLTGRTAGPEPAAGEPVETTATGTPPSEALAAAVAAADGLVRADGGRLDLVAADAGAVTLALRLEGADCAECVMPVEHLEAAVAAAMREHLPSLAVVRIDDPRAGAVAGSAPG